MLSGGEGSSAAEWDSVGVSPQPSSSELLNTAWQNQLLLVGNKSGNTRWYTLSVTLQVDTVCYSLCVHFVKKTKTLLDYTI
jgi:hypothetical protein